MFALRAFSQECIFAASERECLAASLASWSSGLGTGEVTGMPLRHSIFSPLPLAQSSDVNVLLAIAIAKGLSTFGSRLLCLLRQKAAGAYSQFKWSQRSPAAQHAPLYPGHREASTRATLMESTSLSGA